MEQRGHGRCISRVTTMFVLRKCLSSLNVRGWRTLRCGRAVEKGCVGGRGLAFAYKRNNRTRRFFIIRRAELGKIACLLITSSRRSSTRYLVLGSADAPRRGSDICRVMRRRMRLGTMLGIFRRLLRSIRVRI